MRMQATGALVPLLLLSTLGIAAPPEETHRKFVLGTKISLKAGQAKYFLGENIVLHYQIEYEGAGELVVGARVARRLPDCTVIVSDADGKKLPASTRLSHVTWNATLTIRRGESRAIPLLLNNSCRLEKPGKYRVRVAHNLHWTKPDVAIPEDDPRWVETTIELVVPDEEQARKVVEQILGAKRDKPLWEFPDFTCLRYPVYVPILEKMVADPRGDERAIVGLAHNPAPEATRALLRLLKTKTLQKDRTSAVAVVLCERLPEPKGFKRPGRSNPLAKEDADPELVKQSWLDEFTPQMREFAHKWLSDEDPELVRCAAFTLEAIGPAPGRICPRNL